MLTVSALLYMGSLTNREGWMTYTAAQSFKRQKWGGIRLLKGYP
jgi:hypothetical protein